MEENSSDPVNAKPMIEHIKITSHNHVASNRPHRTPSETPTTITATATATTSTRNRHQFDISPPPPLISHYQRFVVTAAMIILLTRHDLPRTQAALGECNFDKYMTGCYSQANFICNPDTHQCECHPEMPVLVERRICVKRAKLYEICQYQEQCDMENKFYCLIHDPHKKLYRACQSNETAHLLAEPHLKCRCLKLRDTTNTTQPNGGGGGGGSGRLSQSQLLFQQQQRSQQHAEQQQQQHGGGGLTVEQMWPSLFYSPENTNSIRDLSKDDSQKRPQTININTNNIKQTISSSNNSSRSSFLPRLVWIFLVISLIGLLAVLFLLRYQPFTSDRATIHLQSASRRQAADDSESHQSELDVPPPYEVAIRMKI